MISDTAPAPQPLHVQFMHLQADMAAHLAERQMGRHAARQHGPRRAVGRKPSPDNEKRRYSTREHDNDVEKQILRGPCRRSDISGATHLSDSQVSRALRRLMAAGRIKKAKGRTYVAVQKEPTTQDRIPT